MFRILLLLNSVLFSSTVFGNDFLGSWEVVKVELPENYFGEIKYPKYFVLSENKDGSVYGRYIDQYDFECEFPLSRVTNSGNELLLENCGTTKHSESWSPLHKVKLIKGRLVGSVVTYAQVFVWYAEPTEESPLTKRSSAGATQSAVP